MPMTEYVDCTLICSVPLRPHEPGDGVRGFLDLRGRVAAASGLDHAVRDMTFEQSDRDRLQRLGRGRDLRQDVDTVRILLDHPVDAPDLPLDPAQPAEQGLLVRAVPVRRRLLALRHASYPTPLGYGPPTRTRCATRC